MTPAQLDELEAYINRRQTIRALSGDRADVIDVTFRDTTTYELRASVLRELLALGRVSLAERNCKLCAGQGFIAIRDAQGVPHDQPCPLCYITLDRGKLRIVGEGPDHIAVEVPR